MSTHTRSDQVRSSGQRERILELLRDRGPEGATNVELNTVCFGNGARIWELRRAGHNIRTENLGDGLFRFVLISSQPPDSNVEIGGNASSLGDVRPAPTNDYARRTRELRDRAMPLFAGVRQ